jgi:hypothetical protein
MAGTICITDRLVWAPAGWVYDNALESIASQLTQQQPELAARLLESRTEINGGYLDLRKLDATGYSDLIKAADAAYREFEARGSESFRRPDFYPGFMNHFRQLADLLKSAYDGVLRGNRRFS